MQTLNVDLEHCYGIKKLKKAFDFSQRSAIAVYAPNGAMKTSLAQTFADILNATASRDRIFPARKSVRNITDENGVEWPKENVFVVIPYDQTYEHLENTSTLLVDSKLRQQHDQLRREIDASKKLFLKSLKEQSGSKKDLETEISLTFTKTDDAFLKALVRVKAEVLTQTDSPFASVRYDTIFDDKVLAFLNTIDAKTAIQEYIEKYNELLSASTYFKKGIFNYYNAATIAKSLADNGFFKARHSVNLNAHAKKEITCKKDLEELIQEEKDKISSDPGLKKRFTEIENQLSANVTLRTFNNYLLENPDFLPHLANIDNFREEIWKSYFKARIDQYTDLVTKFQESENKIAEIEAIAHAQRTQWEDVLDIFNHRFIVPFKLAVHNRTAVILGQQTPVLEFTYEDGNDTAPVEKDELLRVLSMGERKALYILNIIFEVEARKKTKQETVFVIDDIADSFDYKNKYAIIEYLKEISDEPYFRQIILTHNFDFFRTICMRFVGYANCFMSVKSDKEVSLEQAEGVKNVFVNNWKKHFYDDPKKKIACIPFMRNLIEFTKGEEDADYIKLTSLLHWKRDSAEITQGELDGVFNTLFSGAGNSVGSGKKMIEILNQSADDCLTANEGINFENKIVLSVAIRIAAERFMVEKIKDDKFVAGIDANQTYALFKKFEEMFTKELKTIATLHDVVLMTPESIHLNSFMYEPIMDMSDGHLRRLLTEVRALK